MSTHTHIHRHMYKYTSTNILTRLTILIHNHGHKLTGTVSQERKVHMHTHIYTIMNIKYTLSQKSNKHTHTHLSLIIYNYAHNSTGTLCQQRKTKQKPHRHTHISELQIVGAPAPMTHNFSKWHATVKVHAPGWHVIKIKNLPTNFDQPVPLSLTTLLRSLQTEYRKQHQTTASLHVQNIADSGGRTSAALPSVAASG